MAQENLPTTPTGSRFGWPRPRRTDEFSKQLAAADGPTIRVVFKSKNTDVPIIRVPLDLPKYRLVNGRTVSLQQEYLAKNPKVRSDIFSGDPELWDAQEAQHQLLLQVARQSDLQKYFEDTANQQVDAILLDEAGFVVNGNRRLACWRELIHRDPKQYAHFRHIDVAVLPHADERDIDRLEAALQVQKDIKANYSWDAQANMMLAKQRRDGFTNKELAELYGMKEGDVVELLDMRAYADEYLRSRGKANMWSEVSEDEFAFRKISATRPKISGVGSREIFKHVAFGMIANPDEAGGRLYEVIPAIAENLPEVKQRLHQEYTVEPTKDGSALDDMFGASTPADASNSADMLLAQEVQKQENIDRTRKIVVEVIEVQKQLKKDARTAYFLLDCCLAAHSKLLAATKSAFRPETSTKGVSKQLDQIDFLVKKIREFVAKNAKD